MVETNVIHCMDNIKGMRQLIPDNSIDLIVTSPPYNFQQNIEYDLYKDDASWDDYFNFLKKVWKESYRVLKDDGRLIVNIQPFWSDYIPSHHIISKQLLDLGYNFRNEILWEKNNYNCKYTAWGSWKSPSSPYFKYTWEFIEVYMKGTLKKKKGKKKILI